MFLLPISILLLLSTPPSFSGRISIQFMHPTTNFTSFQFIENSGTFLSSINSSFFFKFHNPLLQQHQDAYYLSLLHTPSNTIVWSANTNNPVPSNAILSLSHASLSLYYPNNSVAWTTPSFPSRIDRLQLLETGNLLLLDKSNISLWQSFDHPTDTLLPTQKLPVGSFLTSPVSSTVFSDSAYRLSVTATDIMVRWQASQQYWSLSQDPRSIKDYNTEVVYMEVNDTGLYLHGKGDKVVYQLPVPVTANGFRVGKMDTDGRFKIVTSTGGDPTVDFIAPVDGCELPFTCNTLGLCIIGSNVSTCNCPDQLKPDKSGICTPSDGLVLASSVSSCNSTLNSSVSYYNIGDGSTYFANKYSTPKFVKDLTSCQDICSGNCTCLAFFYANSSRSCYLISNVLGSLIQTKSSDTNPPNGYIKVIKSSSSSPSSPKMVTSGSPTNILAILLPLIASTLLLLILSFVCIKWWRKKSKKKIRVEYRTNVYKPRQEQEEEEEISDSDEFFIQGLPTRFTYDELYTATNNFQTLIGSGGFGSVYKGELPDKTLIAVKKITNIGLSGKKEFCTEIAVIGKIHHINLVKLHGYCAQGSNRMLVYEYMSRGSLDRPLFGQGPALEWQERLDIATGAAKGLSYLHSGCDHKILHCDIKPENILLADHGQVKIADFGMAKLMTPEESGFFTTMRGTRGYLAPEWLTNSMISDKTDVYSYGMVLLEIIRGRKNRYYVSGTSNELSGCNGSSTEYFPTVAVEKHKEGRWMELADPRMEGRVVEEEVVRAVKVALCCLHEEAWMRPSMAMVVGMMEGTMKVWEPRMEGLNFLRRYGKGMAGDGEEEAGGGKPTGSSGASMSLLTYVSSQQVSGPR